MAIYSREINGALIRRLFLKQGEGEKIAGRRKTVLMGRSHMSARGERGAACTGSGIRRMGRGPPLVLGPEWRPRPFSFFLSSFPFYSFSDFSFPL
jgi:hypothetical protein